MRRLYIDHDTLPIDLLKSEGVDLILAQNKEQQAFVVQRLKYELDCPVVMLEHGLPRPEWGSEALAMYKSRRGDLNVFISEVNRDRWGWKEGEAKVIRHGVDTSLFYPKEAAREPVVLSVVNNWIERDWCCGYELWKQVTDGLQTRVWGDTPGLSEMCSSVGHLVNEYSRARAFLNTSLHSPIPFTVLEAMACGCPVVTTATGILPDIITHGENGFLSNDPGELRSLVETLLADEGLARQVGLRGRAYIEQNFSLDGFLGAWKAIFQEVVS